jgi:pilus assembly protein CpaC
LIARRIALAVVMAAVLVALAGSGWAEPAEKTMQLGASEVLDFQGVKRAVVVDPTIADYVVLSAKQIMITTKAPGSTDFHVWDEKGQHTFHLIVIAPPSRMPEVLAKIRETIADSAIKVSEANGVVILEGTVDTPYAAQRAEAIASAYAPKVRNLVQVRAEVPRPKLDLESIQAAVGPEIKVRALTDSTLMFEGTATPEQKKRLGQIMKALAPQAATVDMVLAPAYQPRQILVHVKVVDLNKSALSDIGVDWGGLTESTTEGTARLTAHDQPILLGEVFTDPLALDEGGPIRRLEGLSARLKALVTDNKARILAEPNLLVNEGETANMLVGGEIPIPVVQTATGVATGAAGAITVQWKEFGVRLEIKGEISVDGKSMDLEVTPEVSSLDFGNAIVVSNIVLPALRTRRAHSIVHIADAQTLVIGGLYQTEISKSIRKIPLLGDIPIIGEFFKRTEKTNRDSELLIFVTPEIVTETSAKARTDAAVQRLGEMK